MDGILDRYSPEQIRAALQRAAQAGDWQTVAAIDQATAAALEYRTANWRCPIPDCDGMPHDGWQYRHARAGQNPPPGDTWDWWYLKAGRGYGKTRAGAEFVKDGTPLSLANARGVRWALVARTFSDGRDVMVEGESGLLQVLPPSLLLKGSRELSWNRSMGELTLDNGSRAKVFSSEKPAQLRGPQHHGAWGDEPAYWLDAHKGELDDTTWSNLNLGLRLGDHPRGILTSTPARVKLLIGTKAHPGILNQPDVVVTGGSTFDNLANLAPTFRKRILARYEGTRLGRQELQGEVLADVEGALWTMDLIDQARVDRVDPGRLDVIVVALDPNVTDGPDADECGMVAFGMAKVCPVCGPDERGAHGFVLADATTANGPTKWPAEAVEFFDQQGADELVAEANQGHDLVLVAIRAVDPRVPVRKVLASRGKRVRAEPVAALYEQGRVHHLGSLPELEEQMTGWVPNAQDSPDRMDALVWGATHTMLGTQRRTMRHTED